MSVVGVWVYKLDSEKSECVVTTPSGLQVVTLLVGSNAQAGPWKELLRGHDPKWSSSPPYVTCVCTSAQAGNKKEPLGGHDSKQSSSLYITCGCPNAQAGPWKEPVGGRNPKWSSIFHITYGCPKLDPEGSEWVVTTPSGLQVFTSLVDVRMPKLDPKKS